MGTRLYVGNLPYAVTELDLRDLFGGIGTVTDAKIVTDRETGRPRGFGFVEMSTEDEARKAIEEINGRDVQGRQVAGAAAVAAAAADAVAVVVATAVVAAATAAVVEEATVVVAAADAVAVAAAVADVAAAADAGKARPPLTLTLSPQAGRGITIDAGARFPGRLAARPRPSCRA